MNDDIVVRLRVSTVADSAEHIYQTMTDAADEIERLRTIIKDYLESEYEYTQTRESGPAIIEIEEKWRQAFKRLSDVADEDYS